MGDGDQQPKVDRAAERAAKRGSQSNPDRPAEEVEVRYNADELADRHRSLGAGVRRMSIAGALALDTSGNSTWTLDEAKALLDQYRKIDLTPDEDGEG